AYGLTPADFTWLAAVQNTVFSFSKNGAELVLRLTPETHRPFERVRPRSNGSGTFRLRRFTWRHPFLPRTVPFVGASNGTIKLGRPWHSQGLPDASEPQRTGPRKRFAPGAP